MFGGGRPGPLGGLDRPGTPPGPPGPTVPGMPGTRCAGCSLASVNCTVHDSLFAGVDFEEPGAVVTARQAILGALDGEFLVTGTHEGLSRPFATAVIVECVDVIIPRDECSAQQCLATARGHVPPAFGGPALGILVAERDAHPAGRIVAEPEIGRRRVAPQACPRQCERRHQAGGHACGEGDKRRESFPVMQRSYIKSLKISRDPTGPVNGWPYTPFPRYGKPGHHVRCPLLRADMAKSVTNTTW